MLTEQRVALLLTGRSDSAPAELVESGLIVSTGRPWRRHRPTVTDLTTAAGDDQLIISGRVDDLAVRVTLRPDGARLSITIDWHNTGQVPLVDLALGITVPASVGARVTIPQVIYHDNPAADRELTIPHVGRGGFLTQEHRLPIPAVCAERSGEALILAAVPGPDGHQQGSLGAVAGEDETKLLAASGVIMFDGAPDVDYVHKATIADHQAGYLTLPADGRYRQQWLLERTRTTPPGQGFRQLVRLAEDLYPVPTDDHRESGRLSRGEAIRYKTAALDARWYADGDAAGFLKFPAWGEPRKQGDRPDHDFLYGWTGQCLRLAWCDAWLGLRNKEPWRLDRCRRVVDFYLAGSTTGVDGLRWNHYVHDDRSAPDQQWEGFRRGGAPMISARAHGETLVDLADIIALFADADEPVPEHWRSAVVGGADFIVKTRLRSGIVPIGWRLDGTPIDAQRGFAGASAAQVVAVAEGLTDDERFRGPALELAEAYHRLPGPGFERPYAFSTLDAACEDKESGMAYLRLLLATFDLTGDRRQLDRAAVVADWLLTWVYHTSPRFAPGSMLEQAGFTSRGWPGVSVQNHHLDVFFPTHDLWRLGRLTGEDRFCRWAIEIDTAMRQGICTAPGEWDFEVTGEQAEAFFVTDWQDRGAANTWNPSWVIALPLWQALLLEADDVLDPIG